MSFLPQSPQGPSNGQTPGSNPLTIGGIQFVSISAPEEFAIGAVEQRIAIIETLGGGRQVQTLGAQPKTVEFTAEFWGDQVQPMVQDMRAFVVSGVPQTVTYLDESWTAIVKEFTPTYKFQWRCGYHITLEIITSTNGALTNTTTTTVDDNVGAMNAQIYALIQQLNAQANLIGFTTVYVAWQAYLVALGILYEAEQIF